MRREPKAVLSWIGVWVVVLAGIAITKVIFGGPPQAGGGRPGWWALLSGLGPLAVVLIPALLVLWIMTTATVFRAVISPNEHGWHLFKLGPDEARLGAITAAGFVLMVLFGGAPALVLFVLAKPVLAMAPGLGHGIVDVGALATVGLELWIAVRLSLIAVHTFAEGRYHIVGYWRLTRGHFWRLLASYAIVFVEIALVIVALALAALLSGWLAAAMGPPHGVDVARRAALLVLALAAALMSAVFFVVPSVIVGACQASAYRAIISRPWG
jgi:hypothetical protein